ncbi:hypothetical protein ACFP3U_18360 [Kitasatospora misakiensis]|uniref:PASTA domain-containing protein n=1 Tax=Kitasatospora misakiensis TaxID=67330 RepID=A0ABW0X587_9ACTN
MTSHQRSGVRPAAGRIVVGVVLVAALVFSAVKAVDLWRGDPFPVADPVAVAQRLDAQTQAIYDALELPEAQLDPQWPGEGIEATIYNCHPRGLRNLNDVLSDSPPHEPGTADVHESWALAGVTPAAAVEAIGRARRTLAAAGWQVVSYRDDGVGEVALRLRPPATDDKVAVKAGVWTYPSGRLEVFAGAECLRYPDGTAVDDEGKPDVPGRADAPAQLRSRPAP